jgi:hypothetical protein
MPDRLLLDSTSLTTPPEPRVEAVSNNVDVGMKPGDVMITDDTIYVSYDPSPDTRSAWPPQIPLYQREMLASMRIGKPVKFI